MKSLIIINDAPYGTEKAYNALRLAMQIQKDYENQEVSVFLMADAVGCAIPNQNTPNGYYNIERMLTSVINKRGSVKICTSCVETRGLKEMKFDVSKNHEVTSTVQIDTGQSHPKTTVHT